MERRERGGSVSTIAIHMYRNVYFHKVVRSAKASKARPARAKPAVQGRLSWPTGDTPVHKALLASSSTWMNFAPRRHFGLAHRSSSGGTATTRRWRSVQGAAVSQTVQNHRPVADRRSCARKEIVQRAEQSIAAAGGDPALRHVLHEASDTPYEAYARRSGQGKQIWFWSRMAI